MERLNNYWGLLLFGLVIIGCRNHQEVILKADADPVKAFELSNVTLLEGPFKHATDLNIASLLQYDPDRFLARFRMEAGMEPKAEPYKGWESESLAGHSLGHHLSACALMYQTSGKTEFKERATYIVSELAEIQKANGGQYLAAFSNGRKVFEEEVSQGNIDAQSFYLNGIWAPFYTFHKIMSGLRDVYHVFNNEQALLVERNLADWIGEIVLKMDKADIQTMLNCEFGGIQEALADLYADTKEEKYLEIAKAFHHEAIIDPLIKHQDILPGIHGNTQIPKLIASSRLYELTGDENQKEAAEFFWNTVVNNHSYVTGGHGNHEYFGQPNQLTDRLSEGTTETCNVYNMLKLSRHLFMWEPRAEVGDFYERALFNHILAAQHPETGRVIYNLSLEMGGKKQYQNPESFTCCVGSGMETHSKHGANIYYYNNKNLYINQYISSEVIWKEKDISIRQLTKYPEEDSTCIIFEMKKPHEFTVNLRYPSWCTEKIELTINGWKQEVKAKPGSFIPIKRKWKNNDTIHIKLPFSLRLEEMPDDPNRIAVFYGPVLLSGDLGSVNDQRAKNPDFVPVIMTENRDPNSWLRKIEGQVNKFHTYNVGHPRDFEMIPFYKMHDRRYSVYFDLYNEEKWAAHLAQLQEEKDRKKKLDERTYDQFQPGDKEEELTHVLQGEKLNLEQDFKGRKARGTERGGWLSFEMGVKSGEPMELVLEYWGGFTGSKTFDILIDGEKLATENISGKKDGHFIDIHYPIPEHMLKDKDKITVKFEPLAGHRSGPFFLARTITGVSLEGPL